MLPAAPTESKRDILHFAPGIALSAAIAALAIGLGGLGWLQSHGMSALTVAILLGIVLANTIYTRLAGTVGSGVNFSKQTLLRAGVILYGLRLTLQDIGHVGIAGVLIDTIVLISTLALSWWAGTRVFGLDNKHFARLNAGDGFHAAVMCRCLKKFVENPEDYFDKLDPLGLAALPVAVGAR